ncbi:hypothetical protein FRC17_001232 [Serendipita sp. 399]|nr:hypothetical protein FRC17_001232 [Serendipita sp. 399]
MAAQTDSQIYRGEEKIIVSFDIGTTYSAVSFAHAYPGSEIDVKMVPTLVAYKGDKLVACAAEARDYLDDEEYDVAKWFKLHLHPDSMKRSNLQPADRSDDDNISAIIEIPSLPPNITLLRVFSDFMRYLFDGFRSFFEENTPNGLDTWNRLFSSIVIVLTIPNGWDTRQQGFLKQAAQLAEIAQSEDDAELRIEFVSEGEASVHYVLERINHRPWLREGIMFAVMDAGGSTVDSTVYICKELTPVLVLEEAGGAFVDRAAHDLLTRKLSDSQYGDQGIIGDIVHKFEQRAKRIFDGIQEFNVIEFGSRRENDREHDIVQGKLTLSRLEVGKMFDEVIIQIIASFSKLVEGRNIEHLVLVGGFGESPFLRSRLREEYGNKGTEVVTVDEPSKKAAAEGAVLWYTKQMVAKRVARFTMGISLSAYFDKRSKKHMNRRLRAFVDPRQV